MQYVLNLAFMDLLRLRRTYVITLPRLNRLVRQLKRPTSPKSPGAFFGNAYPGRGLGLTWYIRESVTTLLATAHTKRYRLGFDINLKAFKSLRRAVRRTRVQLREHPQRFRTMGGWFSLPFVREFGAWGGKTSMINNFWSSGLRALFGLYKVNAASRLDTSAWWRQVYSGQALFWAFNQSPKLEAGVSFTDTPHPWTSVAIWPTIKADDDEDAVQTAGALMWLELDQAPIFSLDPLESWLDEGGDYRLAFPDVLVYLNTSTSRYDGSVSTLPLVTGDTLMTQLTLVSTTLGSCGVGGGLGSRELLGSLFYLALLDSLA